MLDQRVRGARPIDGDQQIAPIRFGDLADRGIQDGQVVGGGETARVTGAQQHRQVVADVGTPRAQREEPEPALVGPRRARFGRSRLERTLASPAAEKSWNAVLRTVKALNTSQALTMQQRIDLAQTHMTHRRAGVPHPDNPIREALRDRIAKRSHDQPALPTTQDQPPGRRTER